MGFEDDAELMIIGVSAWYFVGLKVFYRRLRVEVES